MRGRCTLVGYPFALLHSLGFSAERHKISLDDMPSVGRIQPHWQGPWKMVCCECLLSSARHVDGLGQRRRGGQRR